MSQLTMSHSAVSLTIWLVAALVAISIAAGIVGRFLIRRGLRQPLVVRMINRASDRVVDVVKRPITIAVLDEVADVLKAGTYTQNAAAAIRENHQQITAMIAEKIKDDPTAGRIGLLPFHDRLLHDVTETALRVVLAVLADPRTDELFADLLRDNVDQLRIAVRQQDL
jgi:hypothetical protein